MSIPKNWLIVCDYATLRNPNTNEIIEIPNCCNKMEKRMPVLTALGYKQKIVIGGSAFANRKEIKIVGCILSKDDKKEYFYPALMMSQNTFDTTTNEDYINIIAQT